MSPLALVWLLTTRGSLTYIGSYISGAKSTLENSQVSSGGVRYELDVWT